MTDSLPTDFRMSEPIEAAAVQPLAATRPPARRSILRLSKKKAPLPLQPTADLQPESTASAPIPPVVAATPATSTATDSGPLPMPNERDESLGHIATEPAPPMIQAKADLDAGLVDTDLRSTAGLDDERRRALLHASAQPVPKVPGASR